jgi:two-component system cell cycle sensor histidine kinase/response regulator CckA
MTDQPPTVAGRGMEVVLLVEDEEIVRTLIGRTLQDNGYAVIEARDGQEALELYERRDIAIDLIITDVVMPRMSGPELVTRLARSHSDMNALYISGYADKDTVRRHGALHAEGAYLQKPFGPDALLRKVREVLDARRKAA